MLEIHKGRFCRSYENSFFREFTESLEEFFLARKLKGLLLGCPTCEQSKNLQMDVLLVTPGAICVIDFKNYSGVVTLPEWDDFADGQWLINNRGRVKGGSGNKNPFRQLSIQKNRLAEVIRKQIVPNLSLPETIDARFIKRVVCFQGKVKLVGGIPGRESLDFFIADRSNYQQVIGDIVDVETREIILTDNGFHHFNQVFKTVDASEYLTNTELYSNFDSLVRGLSPDQRTVLDHFNTWLKQPSKQVFLLQGSSNSGKSHLIPYLQTLIATNSPTNVLKLAHSKRVANYLNEQNPPGDWKSLYSHIYNLDESEDREDYETDPEFPDEASGASGESKAGEGEPNAAKKVVLPLKESWDDRDQVYIVEEAQLITNNPSHSDLLRFGSGLLLNDFLEFVDLESTDRKIVFIGDSFQYVNQGFALTAIRLDSSPKIPEEKLVAYSLLDKPAYSQLTGESLKCVEAIRTGRFNSLTFDESESLARIPRVDFLDKLDRETLNENRLHILTLQKRSAKQINLRIKDEVMRSGKELATGDLIVLYNSVEARCSKDAAYPTRYLAAWTFARVMEADPAAELRAQKIKDITVNLRTRKIQIQPLNEKAGNLTIFSLENFRERGKVTPDEQKAVQILLEKERSKALKASPFTESAECRELLCDELIIRLQRNDRSFVENLIAGKRVKSELSEEEKEARELVRNAKKEHRTVSARQLRADPNSEYFILKTLAHISYGWAFTVHKAVPLKWEEIILIDDYYSNKGSEEYFRLIYSGLTRATRRASLMDFGRISPWQRTLFVDNSKGNTDLPGLLLLDSESPDEIIAAIRKTIGVVAVVAGLEAGDIREKDFHLLFTLSRGDESAHCRIYYNQQGQVKDVGIICSSPEEFCEKVKQAFLCVPGLGDLSFIVDDWRAEEYERLARELKDRGLTLTGVKQHQYQDRLLFLSSRGKLFVQIAYTGTSTFSRVTALFYDSARDWEAFQDTTRIG